MGRGTRRTKKWLSLCLAAGTWIQPQMAHADFFSRSTNAYVRSGVGPSLYETNTGHRRPLGSGALEAGFRHDVAESGVLIDLWGRVSEHRGREAHGLFRAGAESYGGAVGFRAGKTSFVMGGYRRWLHGVVDEQSTRKGVDPDPSYSVMGNGTYFRVGYQLFRRGNFSLELDATVESNAFSRTRRVDEKLHPLTGMRSTTVGVSTHFGRFCGGKVLTAATVLALMIALCAKTGCSRFDLPQPTGLHGHGSQKC